jgi:hypothetical protein
MESANFFNKLEIRLYSTLISLMSGMSRFKSVDLPAAGPALPAESMINSEAAAVGAEENSTPASKRWQIIQQVLLSLLLWIVLGFAAGFLLGMLKTG